METNSLAPNSLILPTGSLTQTSANAGNICLSGSKLVFYTGTKWELITSS